MSKSKKDTVGSRLRYLRRDILRLTQNELAEKIGIARSLLPTMEADKQGVSRKTASALYEVFGVSTVWLYEGVGSPLVPRPDGGESVAGAEHRVVKKSYSMTLSAVRLFEDPACYRYATDQARFGYVPLSGTRLRLHAARDAGLEGTNLWVMVEDDTTWFNAGEIDGWEFEVLREYLEYRGDREMIEWMECLRLIRWQRQLLIKSDQEREKRGQSKRLA